MCRNISQHSRTVQVKHKRHDPSSVHQLDHFKLNEKTTEKNYYEQLTKEPPKRTVPPEEQAGFRPDRSTLYKSFKIELI